MLLSTPAMRSLGIVCNYGLSDITPESVSAATDDLVARMNSAYDQVATVDLDKVNFENVVKPLIDCDRDLQTLSTPILFPQHCATDKSVREASVAATRRIKEFEVDVAMNKDIFDRLFVFNDRLEAKDNIGSEYRRFVEKEILKGKRNGLHLPESVREEIKALKTRMSDLATTYMSNLSEDTTEIAFDKNELDGVPEDLIKQLKKTSDGKVLVTMKYPHFFPVSRTCRVSSTRLAVTKAFMSVCVDANAPILEEIVALRHRMKDILGYESHAAYIHETLMAKSPSRVASFLTSLKEKLQPLWKAEREEMLRLKEKECQANGWPFNGELDFWDLRYYWRVVEETRYSVDHEALRSYFPLDKVTRGLLEIYQTLLGLTFDKVEGAVTWHTEVPMYHVTDAASKATLGFFFLDLHPREGKYGHAAAFPLQRACLDKDGNRQIGITAIMSNFSRPTEDKPSLLDRGEVVVYFHEFGHVMHDLCCRTDTARFAGADNVERDFVEAPSQMLENWVWQKESLAKMSGHYKDNSPIPDELLSKLVASRRANAGGFNLRQVALATSDQRFHTAETEAVDTAKIMSDAYRDIMGLDAIPGTNFAANWGHLVDGYDAQYYGYLWSEVFSFDMFGSRFKKEGNLLPAVGRDYRDKILAPGGSVDGADLLRDFLGREPNDSAFLRAKGLDPKENASL